MSTGEFATAAGGLDTIYTALCNYYTSPSIGDKDRTACLYKQNIRFVKSLDLNLKSEASRIPTNILKMPSEAVAGPSLHWDKISFQVFD